MPVNDSLVDHVTWMHDQMHESGNSEKLMVLYKRAVQLMDRAEFCAFMNKAYPELAPREET